MDATLNERMNQVGSPSFKQPDPDLIAIGLTGQKPAEPKPTFKEVIDTRIYDLVNRLDNISGANDFVTED